MKTRTQTLLTIAAFAWFFGIILAYYATHKPFDPALLVSVGIAAWRLVVASALVLCAGALGRAVAPLAELPPLARNAIQAALGFGILALGFMLVGVSVGLNRVLLGLALPLLIVLFRRPLLAWLGQWKAAAALWHESDRVSRVIGVILAVLFATTLLTALAPPAKWDALMYHLAMPEGYLRAGKIDVLPWIIMSGMPQSAEMLYTWAVALGGRSAATAFGWSFGLLTTIGMLGYLRWRLNARSAWIGVASLLAGYSVMAATAWAYVDWLALLFGFGCLALIDQWRLDGARWNLALAGALAGMAFATKYTAGVLGLVSMCVVLWHTWQRRDRVLPVILSFGLAAAVFAIPWLAKNWLTTGNPLFPFFFPTSALDEIRISMYQKLPPFGDWQDFFLLPFRATYIGGEGNLGYSVSLGPLLLGLGAFAWIGLKNRSADQKAGFETAAGFALLGWLVWAVGNQYSGYLIQTRMYYALLPALAVLAAFGFSVLEQAALPRIRLGHVAAILVTVVLSLNAVELVSESLQNRTAQAVLGMTAAEEYLAGTLGQYQLAVQAVNELPEDQRVQFIFEPRSLYCAPKCLPDEILDQWKIATTLYETPQEMIAAWAGKGITHLLVFHTGVDYLRDNPDSHYSAAELDQLEAFLADLRLEQSFDSVYALYRLP